MRVDAAAQGLGSTPSDSLRVQRLVGLGMLWGAVDFFHPALAYRAIDWDSAFAAAAPQVRGESTPEKYAGIVQRMLDVLGDPVTRVLPPEPSHAAGPKMLGRWTGDSLLVVTSLGSGGAPA